MIALHGRNVFKRGGSGPNGRERCSVHMIWFFTELRGQGGASVRSDVAYRLSIVGAAAVIVGTAIELGPLMVQNNSDNGGFVGIPIAHTFAQAGFGVAASGMVSFPLA